MRDNIRDLDIPISNPDSAINCLAKGKNQMAIPFVIKSKFLDHIVTAYIDHTDPESHILEFYDSKGLTVADRRDDILVSSDGDVTLGEFMDAMKAKYKPKKIKENTHKHQWDAHNCRAYVLDYITHRAAGYSAEKLQTNPLSYRQAQLDARKMIVIPICKINPSI